MIDSLLKSFQDLFKFIGKQPEKFIKKGTTQLKGHIKAESKGIFTWDNWPYFLAAIAVIALVWLLIRSIRRRRMTAGDQTAPPQKDKTISPTSLRSIWKAFLGAIPGEFRRSILFYQHFLVFGDMGSGKSVLIDTYTDWKGQANQFYPSYTTNPLLQIYLGSKALVQEIPASLLHDTSMQVRTALKKLWKPLFRWRDPVVIVVVNAALLQSAEPEELKRQAQTIRGKINILSRIRKKPPKVGLAVTAADSICGFHEFFRFLQQNNIALQLDIDGSADAKKIAACLAPYEDLLPHALTTLPADAYLKIISFFKHMPERLATLAMFLKILQYPDPLSPAPDIRRLFLTSANDDDRLVCNPFRTDGPQTDIRGLLLLYKHQIAAAAVVLLGFLYMLSGFAHERHLLASGSGTLQALQAPSITNTGSEMQRQFKTFQRDAEYKGLEKLLPRFAHDRVQTLQKKIQSQYAANIRQLYLMPKLEQLAWEDQTEDKRLYLIALTYATRDNRLGAMVFERIRRWSQMLALPEPVIRDYLQYNRNPHEITLPANADPVDASLHTGFNPRPWILFFTRLEKALTKPLLSVNTVQDIRKQADAFLKIIDDAERRDLSATIAELIQQDAALGVNAGISAAKNRNQLLQEPLRAFLTFLDASRIDLPSASALTLEALMDSVRIILLDTDRENTIFRFTIADRHCVFKAADWRRLLNKTILAQLLRDIEKQPFDEETALWFLGVEDIYPDIEMNPTNDGQFIFTGKASIRGIYSREALERDVKPILARLPEFMTSLPVGPNEKNRFKEYVLAVVDRYAKAYEGSYRRYYQQFELQARNLQELTFMLSQLQSAASPLQALLETIHEHTRQPNNDNPYFEPIARHMRAFAFVDRILQEDQDGLSELAKYKTMLAQMQAALLSDKPYEPGETPGPADGLKVKSSPLGRLFLSVYLEEDNSYYQLVLKWLKSVGVGPVWHYPFLDPVYQAYRQGLKEVEVLIGKEWRGLKQEYVDTVLTCYPFKPTSDTETTPENLMALLSPSGPFRAAFNRYILPVTQKSSDTLTVRDFPMGSITLPPNVLQIERGITRLSKRFFDAQGKPKPLSSEVKPLLRPPGKNQDAVVILSHLQSGKSSVFGFYQQPAWQLLQFEWWKYQPSSVGVELATRKYHRKSSRHLSVPRRAWSLLHLLQKAKTVADNTYAWQIESPEMPSGTTEVTFVIKNNFWGYFSLNPEHE